MGASAKKRRTRRKRRQFNAVIRDGRGAAPTHTLKTGRTGGVHYKKLKSRKAAP
jgi:hypothetical protein